MEEAIGKLFDGLYVSHLAVLDDQTFLASNQIVRTIVWTNQLISPSDHLQIVPKHSSRLPSPQLLQTLALFIRQAHHQYLCALIASDSIADASFLAVIFLMLKFEWTMESSYQFVRTKVPSLAECLFPVEQLQNIQANFIKEGLALAPISWNLTFLKGFACKNSEEALLITTIKNGFIDPDLPSINKPESKIKKRRVQWADQQAVNIINQSKCFGRKAPLSKNTNFLLYANSSNVCKKNTQKGQFGNIESQKKLVLCDNARHIEKKRLIGKNEEQEMNYLQFENDLEYLELKQMSRTYFHDKGFPFKTGKRSWLKTKNHSEKSFNNWLKQKDQDQALAKPLKEQAHFLESLRGITKPAQQRFA